MTPEEKEKAEAIQAREQATIPVVILAGLVAYFAVANRADPMAPLLGGLAALWGLYLLLQFRYSWTLLISALIMILGGGSLFLGGQ